MKQVNKICIFLVLSFSLPIQKVYALPSLLRSCSSKLSFRRVVTVLPGNKIFPKMIVPRSFSVQSGGWFKSNFSVKSCTCEKLEELKVSLVDYHEILAEDMESLITFVRSDYHKVYQDFFNFINFIGNISPSDVAGRHEQWKYTNRYMIIQLHRLAVQRSKMIELSGYAKDKNRTDYYNVLMQLIEGINYQESLLNYLEDIAYCNLCFGFSLDNELVEVVELNHRNAENCFNYLCNMKFQDSHV